MYGVLFRYPCDVVWCSVVLYHISQIGAVTSISFSLSVAISFRSFGYQLLDGDNSAGWGCVSGTEYCYYLLGAPIS